MAVILPIEEFEKLMEDIEDLAVIAERRDEPTILHDSAKKKLKQNAHLWD